MSNEWIKTIFQHYNVPMYGIRHVASFEFLECVYLNAHIFPTTPITVVRPNNGSSKFWVWTFASLHLKWKIIHRHFGS